jgi:hypothetical protein
MSHKTLNFQHLPSDSDLQGSFEVENMLLVMAHWQFKVTTQEVV